VLINFPDGFRFFHGYMGIISAKH